MPEAVSSLVAQFIAGTGDLALGNVMGSNTANVGLILGLTACISPLAIPDRQLRYEVAWMLASLLLLVGMLVFQSEITRSQGALLLSLLFLYIWKQLATAKQHKRELDAENAELLDPDAAARESVWKECAFIFLGVGLLIGGGYVLIGAAVDLARLLGISERVIGLTIVAVGTSLPELATSLVAAFRGEHDISIGNVVGSNVFNTLCVVGAVALIKPIHFSGSFASIDSLVMLGFSVALLAISWNRKSIGRLAGGAMLTGYLAYCLYLFI
jgi:cation:H+ antiporter